MATITIMVYFFSYLLLFVSSWRNKIRNTQRLFNEQGTVTEKPRQLLAAHITGICCLALTPAILWNQPMPIAFAVNEIPAPLPVLSYMLLWVVIITIAFRQSENICAGRQALQQYPLQLHGSFFIGYFISRGLFLLLYELWFRGFLLFDCIDRAGMPVAVSLNVLLYVLLHIFNEKKELLACIPFGILACFLNLSFNAVWPAAILHISFSLAYEMNIYKRYLSKLKTGTL